MTKTTHTPGPWRTGAWTSHGMMIRGPKDEYIAYAQGYPKAEPAPYELSEPEAEANSRLIAAAPELLEGLEQAAAAYELLIVSTLDFTLEERSAMEKDLALFEAAIRKARGGQ